MLAPTTPVPVLVRPDPYFTGWTLLQFDAPGLPVTLDSGTAGLLLQDACLDASVERQLEQLEQASGHRLLVVTP